MNENDRRDQDFFPYVAEFSHKVNMETLKEDCALTFKGKSTSVFDYYDFSNKYFKRIFVAIKEHGFDAQVDTRDDYPGGIFFPGGEFKFFFTYWPPHFERGAGDVPEEKSIQIMKAGDIGSSIDINLLRNRVRIYNSGVRRTWLSDYEDYPAIAAALETTKNIEETCLKIIKGEEPC